jgi:hypothetical protein
MTPNRKARAALALGLLSLTTAAPAAAQIVEGEAAHPKLELLQATFGVRTSLIRSAGYDPFSSSDALPQISMGVAHPIVLHDAVAVAVGLAIDYGLASSEARGVPSGLSAWRLSVVGEGRFYPRPYAYGFARLAPGIFRGAATLDDASSPNGAPLEDHFDLLSADASVGGALRLNNTPSPMAAWVCADAGYGFTQSHHLLLAPAAPPRDQAKLGAIDLGTINPRGAFVRFTLAVTF